jgi:two-component system, OmpR family, phosphate regulon response regulator PhoB
MVSLHLKENGYQPVVFDSAEKAYAALRAKQLPALIILDMLLPGMSGVDFIRLVKQNKAWEKIPVVVVSVLSRQEDAGTYAEDATAFWINKPFDAHNLIQTVQKVLTNVAQGKGPL